MVGSADPGVTEGLITLGSSVNSSLSVFTDCLEICVIAQMYSGGCSSCSSTKMRHFVFLELIGLFVRRGSDKECSNMCLKTELLILPPIFSFPLAEQL